ncbi:MAG: YraN family protein [Clostridia bacterium]|nr:YraN family protein [Clostridia bacterium]
MNRRKIGDGGETYAARLMEKQGYRIVMRNFTARGGEIDLIAENEEYIVFCEVKLRDMAALYRPSEAVTRQKQQRIIHTAMCYLQQHPSARQPRFDVVAITAIGGTITQHEWIENAFTL